MRFIHWPVLLLLCAYSVPTIDAQPVLYSVSTGDNLLRTIDPETGMTISSVPIVLDSGTAFGATGVAREPRTEQLWAILKTEEDRNHRPRTLAIIDRHTGDATMVGDLGDSFAGIAFDSSGTLYAVTGDGAQFLEDEALFSLNKSDGTPTLLATLGIGSDGEEIAFNPDDGKIYHASGYIDITNDDGGERAFESIDLTTFSTAPISISGYSYEEVSALTYDSANEFLAGGIDSVLFRLNTSGEASLIGQLDHNPGGLAFVPEPSAAMLAVLALAVLTLGIFEHVVPGGRESAVDSKVRKTRSL